MIEKDVTVFAVLLAVATLALTYVGESRPDAYLSVAILTYFIYTSVNYGFRLRVKLKAVDLSLMAVFILIVAHRVYEILEVVRYLIPA